MEAQGSSASTGRLTGCCSGPLISHPPDASPQLLPPGSATLKLSPRRSLPAELDSPRPPALLQHHHATPQMPSQTVRRRSLHADAAPAYPSATPQQAGAPSPARSSASGAELAQPSRSAPPGPDPSSPGCRQLPAGMHPAAAAAAQTHPSQPPLPGQAAELASPSEEARSAAQGKPGALYDTAADFGGASPASELDPGGQGLERNEFSPLSLLWDSPAPTPRQRESLRKTSFWQLSPIKPYHQLHPASPSASAAPSAPCEQEPQQLQQQHEPDMHTPAAQPAAAELQQGLQLTPALQPPETPLQVSLMPCLDGRG